MRVEPTGGPQVQGGCVPGIDLRAQKVGEQAVVAIPLTLVIERDEEQVGRLQMLQNLPTGQICKSANHPLAVSPIR